MKKLILLTVSFLITQSSFSIINQQGVDGWVQDYVAPLPAEQISVIKKLLTSSYQLAKIDIKVRQLSHALLAKNIEIHDYLGRSENIEQHLQEVANLIVALSKLVPLQQAALMTWQNDTNIVDEIADEVFQEAINALQEMGQEIAIFQADAQRSNCINLLSIAHAHLAHTIQVLHFYTQTLQALSESNTSTRSIVLMDTGWNIAEKMNEQIGRIMNATAPLRQQSEELQEAACELFNACLERIEPLSE